MLLIFRLTGDGWVLVRGKVDVTFLAGRFDSNVNDGFYNHGVQLGRWLSLSSGRAGGGVVGALRVVGFMCSLLVFAFGSFLHGARRRYCPRWWRNDRNDLVLFLVANC